MGQATSSSTLSLPRPTTDDELLALLYQYLGVKLSKKACCTGHTAPAKAFCDAYFARGPVHIWKAARGVGGKSYMLAALVWMESVTLQANCSVLGGSGQQSKRVHDYTRQFWMRPTVPHQVLASDPSMRETRLTWGNVVEVQNASQASVRGFHGPRLRIDEADECEWSVADAARGQAMDQHGILSNVVFSSTHQNADGTMTKLLREAAEKGWQISEWCWRENMAPSGWLTEAAKERYRQTVSTELWRVEVELGEPSPEGRAIVPTCVEQMFSQAASFSLHNEVVTIKPGVDYRDAEGEYFEFELPVLGAIYATGADWGKGDETVIWTWRVDCTPMRTVAYEHLQRRPMPWMIERLMERVRRFPGDAFHDATGVGTYHHDQFTEVVDDYVMVGKKRNDLFTNYITAVEGGECVCPRILSAYHAHKYVRNKDLYGAREERESGTKAGHPPDPLVAGAMGYAAALNAKHPLALAGGRSTGTTATGIQAVAATAQSPLRALTAFMKRETTNGPQLRDHPLPEVRRSDAPSGDDRQPEQRPED